MWLEVAGGGMWQGRREAERAYTQDPAPRPQILTLGLPSVDDHIWMGNGFLWRGGAWRSGPSPCTWPWEWLAARGTVWPARCFLPGAGVGGDAGCLLQVGGEGALAAPACFALGPCFRRT